MVSPRVRMARCGSPHNSVTRSGGSLPQARSASIACPTRQAIPPGICNGPDGALWFTEYSGDRIGRITTSGVITEYPVPTSGSEPVWIAAGPDGALWFVELSANKVGRISTAGAITEYALPASASGPMGIAPGPDGALWFAGYRGNLIGRITTDGAITTYTAPSGSNPDQIAPGPDGALWFTGATGLIGRITTSGLITEYPVKSLQPWGITTGPDGALWFAEFNNSNIGRAPDCALALTANYSSGALTMNYDLGIDTPATFDIILHGPSGPIGEPFSKNIDAVIPPHAFTMTWTTVPNVGNVTVQAILQTGAGQPICSQWATVNTAQ
jgi:streptogramin lyase